MSRPRLIHHCHATGCTVEVPPKLLMCERHWGMVTPRLQSLVEKYYVRGQEKTQTPSKQYLLVAREAIEHVAKLEGEIALDNSRLVDDNTDMPKTPTPSGVNEPLTDAYGPEMTGGVGKISLPKTRKPRTPKPPSTLSVTVAPTPIEDAVEQMNKLREESIAEARSRTVVQVDDSVATFLDLVENKQEEVKQAASVEVVSSDSTDSTSNSISPSLYEPHVTAITKLQAHIESDAKLKRVEAQFRAKNESIQAQLTNFSITDEVGAQIISGLLVQNARNEKMVGELLNPLWKPSKDLYEYVRGRRDDITKVQAQIATTGKSLLGQWETAKRLRVEQEQREAELVRQQIESAKRAENARIAQEEQARLKRIFDEQLAEALECLGPDATEEERNEIRIGMGAPPVVIPKPIVMPPPPQVMSYAPKMEGNTSVENWEVELTDKEAILLHCIENNLLDWVEVDMGKVKKYANLLKGATNLPGIRAYRKDTIRTSSR